MANDDFTAPLFPNQINPIPNYQFTPLPGLPPTAPAQECPAATPPASPSDAYTLTSVDAITLTLAIITPFVTMAVRKLMKITVEDLRRKFIVDFLSGSVIYPFVLLVASPFNKNIFNYIQDSKLAIAIAGVVGIAFVIGELVLSCFEGARQQANGERAAANSPQNQGSSPSSSPVS